MTDFVIETNQLRKSFRGQHALRGLDLRVPAGSIFGFLGRNGAGKTTTLKILMGMMRCEGGSARVFGVPVKDEKDSIGIRRRVGFVTEDKNLYPYMTVEQVISFTRPFFPKWRNDLEMFELPPKRAIPHLSKGMLSKLMLLLAIARGAELLIMDEPTDGLDPSSVEEVMRELVSVAASEGTTILFSSHQLAEVETIADHIGIVDRGQMVVTGSLDEMRSQYQRIRVVLEDAAHAPTSWVPGVKDVRQDGRVLSILASRNADAIVEQARSLPQAMVERFPVTLKEIFLEHVRSN